MSCAACLGRKAVALALFPRRRPLYVRCGSCKMRRRARWHVVSRAVAVAFGAVFAIVVCVAGMRGYYEKVAWEIRGLVGR